MFKLTAALVVAVLALVACPASEGKVETTSPTTAPADPVVPTTTAPVTPPPPADPKAEADTIFTQRCSVCHGMSGTGDGPGAAALNPKPRNYSDAAWQKSVDDAYLAKVIVEGGASVGKSPLMVANADLKDKPEVVAALVAKVRSFGAAAAAPAPTK